MNTDFDVIIVGAGLVGLTLACILAKNEFNIAVVDSRSIEAATLAEDFELKVSAINHACQHIFNYLNIWEKITASKRGTSFEKMFVWDSLGRGEIHFNCREIGKSHLGFILENAVMHNALLMELANYPNVSLLGNQTPTAISLSTGTITLELLKQKSIVAKLLVGADGGNSWVRDFAKIDFHSWSYDHSALVATVKTKLPHRATAWQCFLPHGPLALLPLHSPHHCSIVWSAAPMEIQNLQSLNTSDFDAKISKAFEYRLGNMEKVSKEFVVPLYMRHCKEYVANRIALVGDAAHTIHPLAGQGVNLGILDAATLSEMIVTARDNNADWGSHKVLREYERCRKSENWLMVLGMEFFKRLFQSRSKFFIRSRSYGLNLADRYPLMKDQFIYYATGLKGELPKIAQ